MTSVQSRNSSVIEIYLRLTGETQSDTKPKDNNLLEAIQNATKEDVNTDDLPELQQAAASDTDVVE